MDIPPLLTYILLIIVTAISYVELIPIYEAVIPCPDGFTGPECKNPICDKATIVDQHDGLEGNGDYLFWDYSFTPNQQQQQEFYVDEYVNTIVVRGYAAGMPINFEIYKNGNLITPSKSDYDEAGWYSNIYQDLGVVYGSGQYTVNVLSDRNRPLELEISSPTPLVIDGGFVTDQKDDFVQEVIPLPHQGIGLHPKINISSYFAFQISDVLKRPGKATSVTVFSPNGNGEAKEVMDRYGCTAFQYAGEFICDDISNIYRLKVSGYDSRGNHWDRVYPYICEIVSVPTAPPTFVPPTECRNGGIMINEGTENAECYCGHFFEGNSCETKRCFHNGVVGYMDKCVCESGYSGEFCRDVSCERSSTIVPLREHAFVFVVRTGRSMIGHIQQIITAVEGLASIYSIIDASYVNSWILITVSQGSVEMNEYSSTESFIEALQNIQNVADTICNDKLYEGIRIYLASSYAELYRRSSIFVFSDGLPDDNEETRYALYHQLSFFRGQIFFMLADSSIGRCNIDPSSEAYRGLEYIARFTHGHVSYVKLDRLSQATNLLGITMHKPVHIMTNDLMDSCRRAPKYQSFFIDESIQVVWISATGSKLSVTVIGPDRNPLALQELLIQDKLHIWSIPDPRVGGYMLSLESPMADPCSIRVYGSTDSALWVGVATEVNEDVQFTLPITTSDAHIVAYIAGVDIPDSMQVHAEAIFWSNEGRDDKRVVTYASNGVYRDYCSYNLYFGAYKCTTPFQFYYINVFMTSKSGSIIQRTTTAYCSSTAPTRTPSTDCLNGGFSLDNNGTCLCLAHYSGDKCQNIECLNLGTPIGGICSCISSFSGVFCEVASCHSRNTDFVFSPNGRSLTFVIQDSISTRTTIKGIQKQIPSLYQDITHQHKYWISNFQIWRFNDSSFTNVVSSRNPNDFVAGMDSLVSGNTMKSDASCRDLYVIPGLLNMLDHPGVSYDGIVYLFISGYIKFTTEEMAMTEAVYVLLENTRVKLNVVLMSASPCGKDMNSPAATVLMNMAEYSGGEFIMVMPSKAGNVVRSIPTLYRGSFVYENYVTDCTVPQNFYFPVDSQMQSFTAYVLGETEDDSVKYYRPSGAVLYPQEVYSLWKDIGMGSRMDQIIRMCDNNWNLFDNRCYHWGVSPKVSWETAQNICHSNNAILLMITSQAEEDFIYSQAGSSDFWIGLNDISNNGVYVWDTHDGSEFSLDSTKFTNWGNGEPHNDLYMRCVHDRKGVGWKVGSCNEQRSFICVKHAYDAEYEPDETNIGEVVERGIWKVTVKTTDGPCYVQIYGQSGIELYSRFATDIHDDIGTPEPLTNAANNRFISHITNQQSLLSGNPGHLEYAHFYQNNMSIIEAKTYQIRDTNGCSFEYISTGFKCPSQNFLSLTTGIDRFGYLYQRIQPIGCFNGPKPGECINGVYYEGRCLCDPNYTGELCSVPICKYGTLDINRNMCHCDRGFVGVDCSTAICNRQSSSSTCIPSAGNRTFVVLIDGSKTGRMATVSTELREDLEAVLKRATAVKDWFTHFTGIIFRDSSASDPLSDVIEAVDTEDFINKIMTEYGKDYTPTSEGRSVVAALNKVLQSEYIQMRSHVWIVTGGYPEDSDKFTIALDAAARHHAYINFLIIGDTSGPGGIMNYTDSRVLSCVELSLQTGGQYYQVSDDAGQLKSFWQGLMSVLYDVYEISVRMKSTCAGGFSEFFQVGSNTSTLVTNILGGGTFTILDANGSTVSTYRVASSRMNSVLVVEISEGEPGLWQVVGSSHSGFCGVAITGQSSLDVYIAFTLDVGLDGGLHSNDSIMYPFADGAPNAVVAYSSFGKLKFVQIFRNDERILLWSSPLVARKQCVYNYVSMNTFVCTDHSFAVAVDGEDDNGYPFRRMIHVHCIGSVSGTGTSVIAPTQSTLAPVTLPPPSCDPSGKFDIFFVFDASETVAKNEFEKILEGAASFLSDLKLGDSNVRVAFATYCDELYMLNSENFEWITAINVMNTNVRALEEYGYTGVFGNNIQSIFDVLPKASWRTDAKHVLVFVSSVPWNLTNSGTPFNDPQNSAQQFLQSGGKIIPIGFGPSSDEAQLRALGQQCTHMAPTIEYYTNVIQPWLAKAVCNDEQYCTTS